MKYERISFRTEHKDFTKAVILRDPSEHQILGAICISGIEVDGEGQAIKPRGADERQRIIDTSLIVKRIEMRMDNKYGVLRPVTP